MNPCWLLSSTPIVRMPDEPLIKENNSDFICILVFLSLFCQLLEPGRQVGLIRGNSVEDFLKKVNSQLLSKARHYEPRLPTETALALLMYVQVIY